MIIIDCKNKKCFHLESFYLDAKSKSLTLSGGGLETKVTHKTKKEAEAAFDELCVEVRNGVPVKRYD